jgi:hypothetical protein
MASRLLLADFLLGLLFDPEHGDSIFFQTISVLMLDYTLLHPRRQQFSLNKYLLIAK